MTNIIKYPIIITAMVLGQFIRAQNFNEIVDFGDNPGNLKMRLYIPSNISIVDSLPLLVALHGCSQNAESLLYNAGWKKIADKNKFLILFPEQRRINNSSDCFNWFKPKDYKGENGEAASILSMIDWLNDHYKISVKQKFIYGVSAGAALSIALMAENPCLFSAGASVAGGPYMKTKNGVDGYTMMNGKIHKSISEWGTYLSKENIKCKPRLIIVHGTEDRVVDPKNAIELSKQWLSIHNDEITDSLTLNVFENERIRVTRISKVNKLKDELIIVYSMDGVGHRILIDSGNDCLEGGRTGAFTQDEGFFSTYHIANDLGLITLNCP